MLMFYIEFFFFFLNKWDQVVVGFFPHLGKVTCI